MSVCVKLSVLLALVSLLHSGSADEKVAPCCTTVSRNRITEPIIGVSRQKKSGPCVEAVIFQTENGRYCIYHRAHWVSAVIQQLLRKQASDKAQSTVLPSAPSKVSLLSVITSTAQTSRPSSAQTSRPSSAQTSRPSSAQTSRPSSAQTSRPSSAQTSRPSSAQTSTSSAQTSRP